MNRLAGLPVVASLAACGAVAVQPSPGESVAAVRIDAAPDPAWIFVDGRFVGGTPLKSTIVFTHATRFVEIVAVPLHERQTRQVLRVVPPALPRRVQFFMDNQDPRAVTR
jgi:hypothetical protein